MGSIRIYENMPPLTDEQIKRLDALALMTDDDIDYKELARMKPARLREKNFKKVAS